MQTQEIMLENEAATVALACALEQTLPAQAVVVLSGTLGAGKTRFVQAFAEAAGIDRQLVTSPTFVLCQHHQGNRCIHHLDAYRMQSADEFIDLGGLELIQDQAITFIEWGERIDPALPDERIEMQWEVHGETRRRVQLRFSSCFAEAIQVALDAWA